MTQGNPWGQQPGFGVAPGHFHQPPPGAPDPRALSLQRGLLIAMLPLHVLMFLSQSASVALQLITEGVGVFSGSTPNEQGEIVGRFFAAGCFLIWAVVGGVWGILNLNRLGRPTPELRRSLGLYWWFSALSCLCFPLGIVGLVNLARDDVKRAFG